MTLLQRSTPEMSEAPTGGAVRASEKFLSSLKLGDFAMETSAKASKSQQNRPVTPARRDYKPDIKPVSLSALPFIHYPKRGFKNASKWHVQPTDDYGQACNIGREYAAHFVQFMKDNPYWVGGNTLGRIAADVNFKDESSAQGYWVGFFSQLERLIYAAARHMDVFADVDKVNAHYAEIAAQRALEAEAEGV